jgi:hypothetical protein
MQQSRSDEDASQGWDVENATLRALLVNAIKAPGSLRYVSDSASHSGFAWSGLSKTQALDTARALAILDGVSNPRDHGAMSFDKFRVRLVDELINTTSIKRLHAYHLCSIRAPVVVEGTVHSGLTLKPVIVPRQSLVCVIGPVVGCVTSTQATMMFEFTGSGTHGCASGAPVSITVCDLVTSVRYVVRRHIRFDTPTAFLVEGLIGGRAYDVRLVSDEAIEYLVGDVNPSRPVSLLGEDIIVGSFRTRPMSTLTPRVRSQHDAAENGEGVSGESRKRLSGGQVGDGSAAVVRALPASNRDERSPLKLLALGAITPSLSVPGTFIQEYSQHSALATVAASSQLDLAAAPAHREFIVEGLLVCSSVKDSLLLNYGSTDLTIHLGGIVDLGAAYEEAISALLLAEATSSHVLVAGEIPKDEEVARLVARAENAIRNGYRVHWGGFVMRELLAHGSHLFVGSPVVDLLRYLHTASVRELCQALSPVRRKSVSL